MDLAPSCRDDKAANRGRIPSWTCVEDFAGYGLDPATSGEAGSATRRRKSAVMVGPEVGGGKKNARRQKAWIFFEDESGVSERPAIRRTWAPKGETPVLIHSFNWKKLSVCAAIGYRWDGRRSRVFFQTRPGSYDSDSLIGFLEDLRREMRGRKVILIWDGLPGHHSRVMTAYLESQRRWLRVERLPAYAPDLNPVEMLWGNIKGQELANRCAEDLIELDTAVHNSMDRVAESGQLAFSFLDHVGLSF